MQALDFARERFSDGHEVVEAKGDGREAEADETGCFDRHVDLRRASVKARSCASSDTHPSRLPWTEFNLLRWLNLDGPRLRISLDLEAPNCERCVQRVDRLELEVESFCK